MKKAKIIYIIGFAGSGKLTVAKELAKTGPYKLIDNHKINDVIFSVLPTTENIPNEVWNKIDEIRQIVIDTIALQKSSNQSYIFTNELIENDPFDLKYYQSIVNLSKEINASLLPIVIYCNLNCLEKRIQSADRKGTYKIIDAEYGLERIKGKKLFVPRDAFTIDTSELSVDETVKKILRSITHHTE